MKAKSFSEIVKLNKSDNRYSLYIGLNLNGSDVSDLAIPGGENPDDYHVTLLYGYFEPKGDEDDTAVRIQTALEEIKDDIPDRVAFLHEQRFEASESSDKKDVIVARAEGGYLEKVHSELLKELKNNGINVETTFPEYIPHMTLAYIEPGAEYKLRELDHSAAVKDISIDVERKDSKTHENEFKMNKSDSDIDKFNPYHDSLGRFTTSGGGASFSGTLLHGSPNKGIKEFDINRAGSNTGSGEKLLFFTNNKQMADDFSYERLPGSTKFMNVRGKKGEVYRTKVRMKKPLDFRNLSDDDIKAIKELDADGILTDKDIKMMAGMKNHGSLKAGLDLRPETLSRLGYDGIIANAGNGRTEFAVIDSKQTKIIHKNFSESEVKELNNADTELCSPPFNITKADEDKRLVFGWALVSADKDGNKLIDRQGDMVEPDDLEDGAYEYVLNFRDAGEEHIGTLRKKARMVESCVFTPEKMKAIGIPEGTIPVGWWIGFYVDDDTTWERIKSGKYKMFSIEGKAVREPIEDSQPHPTGEIAKSFSEIIEKFNPYHGKDGRFVSGSGGNYASFTYAPGKSKAHDNAIAREKDRAKQRAASGGGGSNSDNSSHETSNKIKQEFIDAGLNSRLAGVRRRAQEGTEGYSYKDASPVSASEASNISNMHFVERNGKTLVHGIVDNKKVFYANSSDSKEIKALRQKAEERKHKQAEDMKHRPDTIRTTSTYDRWKRNHDKNFEAWFGKSKSFSELMNGVDVRE